MTWQTVTSIAFGVLVVVMGVRVGDLEQKLEKTQYLLSTERANRALLQDQLAYTQTALLKRTRDRETIHANFCTALNGASLLPSAWSDTLLPDSVVRLLEDARAGDGGADAAPGAADGSGGAGVDAKDAGGVR